VLEVDEVSVRFDLTRGVVRRSVVGTVNAVDRVSLAVGDGETLALVGESGSGKTTLGRAIVGLYRPSAGAIRFRGADVTSLDRDEAKRAQANLQMVFQDPYASLNPRWRVAKSIEEPLRIHRIGSRASRHRKVVELLDTVGLSEAMGDRFPHELSGGQRQRVGLARALALEPAVVVADEPVSALDVSIQAQILNLLQQLQREFGLAYLFIAHDLSVVEHIGDRVAVMYLGKIVELAASEDLFRQPMHPYTVSLLSAIPVPDPAVEKRRERIVLRGEPPSPASPPTGCRFHPRCWLREELGNPVRCEEEEPVLQGGAGHTVACHFTEELEARRFVLAAGPLAGEPPAAG
jgi:oligopeptide/dipeptide ABC transporter ATP-binding protein